MSNNPTTASDHADAIQRTFFGLDEHTLQLLEHAMGGSGSDEGYSSSAADHHNNNTPTDDEDFNDVLISLGDHTDDTDDDDDEGAIDMGAPSESAGFGMLTAPSGSSGGRKKGSSQCSSSMWAGLAGVAGDVYENPSRGVSHDGTPSTGVGMGAREISAKAEEGGYDMFLEEIELLSQIYTEDGDVEMIRRKSPAAKITRHHTASATTASAKNSCEDEEGSIIGVRVQLLPLRILEAFNKRMATLRQSGASGNATRFSKGLHVTATYVHGYPDRPPLVSVEPWHNLLPTNAVVMLNKKIVEILNANQGSPALMTTLMMIGQEAEVLIDSYEEGDIREIAAAVRGTGIRTRLSSEAMHPDRYLGTNLASIMAKMPKNIVVQCVENIMRTDLALSFEKMQRYLFKKNVEPYTKMKNIRSAQHIIEQAEATPSFHGTRMETVGYIVRDGLLVPGKDSGIGVRCGSRFGNGIYSSPDPNFASMYAERCGQNYKLILCATLLGRRDHDEGYEEIRKGCDSRVADDGLQYVVFHRAQILPCYVLHIKIFDPVTMQPVFPDLRHTLKAELRDVRADAAEGFFDSKEIEKRRKQILTQMARKNLPFGYGPRGIHFVVEGIAEVSDEDEGLDTVERVQNNSAEELYQHESMMKNRYGTSHKHPGDV